MNYRFQNPPARLSLVLWQLATFHSSDLHSIYNKYSYAYMNLSFNRKAKCINATAQTKLIKRRKMYECIFNYLHRWTMPVFMTSDTCPRIFNELSNSITRCFLCLFSHMIVVEMQMFWRREQHVFIILQLYCKNIECNDQKMHLWKQRWTESRKIQLQL